MTSTTRPTSGRGRSRLLLGAICAASLSTTAPGLPSGPCRDPCLQAARATFAECSSSASGAFLDALDGCIAHDRQCVDACRAVQADCRDDLGTTAEVAACRVQLAADQADCRARFDPGSKLRAACLDRAAVAASRCRTQALRRAKVELTACRQDFKQCRDACGPGEPPGGSGACRAEGRAAFRATVAECNRSRKVTVSACIGKVVDCVPDCSDAREACTAPAREALGAAVGACTTQEKSDVAGCITANPVGSPALEQCVAAARAAAWACREAAVATVNPELSTCAKQYVVCVRACPGA